eukprot:168260-Rhodomonas_salina.6
MAAGLSAYALTMRCPVLPTLTPSLRDVRYGGVAWRSALSAYALAVRFPSTDKPSAAATSVQCSLPTHLQRDGSHRPCTYADAVQCPLLT